VLAIEKYFFFETINRCISEKIKFKLNKYIYSIYFKCMEFKKNNFIITVFD
jgi:hypothetical protein